MAFAQRTMQTPDPPNLNRCCWVRVYNPRPFPPVPFTFNFPGSHVHDPSSAPICFPELRAGRGELPVTQGTVESDEGENTPEHRALQRPPVSPHWCRTALHQRPKTATWHPNGVHVDLCKSSLLMAPLYYNVWLSLSPAPRKGHNQCKDTYIVFTQVYKVVWRWWLILHSFRQTDTQTHRHMPERVSLPFDSVCWNQRWNQRYDNLATKPGRQCSAPWAALRVLWFTAHVDIPPFALKHTQHKHTHPCVNSYTRAHTTHTSRNKNLKKRGTNPLMASGQKASFPSSHCRSRRACGGLLVSL